MSLLLQQIDETNRRDHWYLDDGDDCHYLYEYTSGQGWRGGETNQLIHNLQKKRGDGGFHYKAPAIARCANDLSAVLNAEWLAQATIVPVPPSKILPTMTAWCRCAEESARKRLLTSGS